ncbi:MAG: HNH endonuclease family protein, partial [Candidatus Neomarinimicrobiota bacterium]
VYTNNLEFAKNFFDDYLKTLAIKQVEELYVKVTQRFLFNIYSISTDIDVFVAFETMNNRGKPLSHLELLKNRLIYLSTKFDVDYYEKSSLRKRINDCWKAIYHNLGRNKENPLDDDTFLVNHFLIYFGSELFEKNKNELESFHMYKNMRHYYRNEYSNYLLEKKFTSKNIKDTENKISIGDIDNYVKSLQHSVVAWYKIFNPVNSDFTNDIKKWLDKLNRIGIYDSAPLILIFFQQEKNNNKRLLLLKLIERMKFLFSMTAYRHFLDYDPVFLLRIAINLNEKNITADKVLKEIDVLYYRQTINREINIRNSKEFRNNGFYKWQGIRYFLFEYDLYLQENSKTSRKKLIWQEFSNTDYETVEHIYPRSSRAYCWTSSFQKYTTKERGILKDSLGNLLPLSRAKNSSFSNKCFKDKISNDKNSIGYRFGCYAENEITKFNEWTAVQILERGLQLLNFLEERWEVKLGNDKEKLSFLNLDFVLKKEKLPLTQVIANADIQSKKKK